MHLYTKCNKLSTDVVSLYVPIWYYKDNDMKPKKKKKTKMLNKNNMAQLEPKAE